ncbi:MAG: PilZ domain-containing protein [Acidobacteriota bacterium]
MSAAAAKKPARKPAGKDADRRREKRATIQIPVLYHVEDGVEERVSATLDVSLSGLQFPTKKKLREDDRVLLRLLIPGEVRPLMLHGVVRWSAKDMMLRGRYNVGVSFEKAESAKRKVLEKFLA